MSHFTDKIFIDALQMEKDCWDFAKAIYAKGHDFDILSGITRGGAQICIYMQEVFALLSGSPKAFTTIHAQSYTGIGEAHSEVSVENLESLKRRVTPGIRILIVDDIFDRGKTFHAVNQRVLELLGEMEATVKLASLYYKPDNNIVDIEPDFYFKTFASSDWIVLPHELEALSPEELKHKGFTMP